MNRMYLIALVALGSLACATSPTGRKQLLIFPDSQMSAMGATAFTDLKKGEPVSTNAAANAYVRCVSQAVLNASRKELGNDWEIVVFEKDMINAFALPGKKIGVYTGMMNFADSPDQLAAVIGHEIAHVTVNHGNERVSEAMAAQGVQSLLEAYKGGGETKNTIVAALGLGFQFGRALPHGRAQESEADRVGLTYMARAGFNPGAAVALWTKMAKLGSSQPEFLSTHPSPTRRAKELQAAVPVERRAFDKALKAGRKPNCKKPS